MKKLMKNFEALQEMGKIDQYFDDNDELALLDGEILKNNDPIGCANYISGRIDAAKKEIDQSKRKDVLKNVFSYMCGISEAKRDGEGNFQEVALASVNMDLDTYFIFKSFTIEDFSPNRIDVKLFNKTQQLLAGRMKVLDPNFKG